jgi:hypothetical protein
MVIMAVVGPVTAAHAVDVTVPTVPTLPITLPSTTVPPVTVTVTVPTPPGTAVTLPSTVVPPVTVPSLGGGTGVTVPPVTIPGSTAANPDPQPQPGSTSSGGASSSPTPAKKASGTSKQSTDAGRAGAGATGGKTGADGSQPAAGEGDRVVRLRGARAVASLAVRSLPAFAIPVALAMLAAAYLIIGAAGEDKALTTAPVNSDDDLLRFS